MRILLVAHGFPPEDLGGTELHAFELARALKARAHDLHVFARIGDVTAREYEIRDRVLEGLNVRRIVNNQTSTDERPDINPVIRDRFRQYLDEVRPDIVHVHHLLALSTGIPDVISAAGLPYCVTLHDYWFGCGRIQLLRPDESTCDGPLDGMHCAKYCRRDLPERFAAGRHVSPWLKRLRDIAPLWKPLRALRRMLRPSSEAPVPVREEMFWRKRVADFMAVPARAGVVIAPSRHVAQRFIQWGTPPGLVRVIPHGISSPAKIHPRPASPVVAYLGAWRRYKGIHHLIGALAHLSEDVRLEIWGGGPDELYNSELRTLAHAFGQRVRFKGRYGPEELDRILAGVSVVAVPSLWEETFCYVAREAQVRGRPVVVSRIGALSEAVEEGRTGFSVPPGDERSLAAALREALSPAMNAESRKCLPLTLRTPEDYAAEMEAIYLSLLS